MPDKDNVPILPADGKLGVLIPGIGAVSTTFIAGVEAVKRGLGAPVGSMLVGTRVFIDKARSVRKALGGGMRQAGVLAAAGLIALEQMPKRLHEDHANARFLAESLAQIPALRIHPEKVKTNIVIFDVSQTGLIADAVLARLRENGLIGSAVSDSTLRLVTHMDVSRADCEHAVEIIGKILR